MIPHLLLSLLFVLTLVTGCSPSPSAVAPEPARVTALSSEQMGLLEMAFTYRCYRLMGRSEEARALREAILKQGGVGQESLTTW